MVRRHFWELFLGIILVNFVGILLAIEMGLPFDDVAFFFQERETVTFFSALQLAIVSMLSLFVYLIKKLLNRENARSLKMARIWLISFLVFAFATADEYLMAHEGIDGEIASFFFGVTKNLHLDGITLGLYGVLALFLFFKFKKEILKYKDAVFLFCVCGFFFLISICLDIGSTYQFRIVLEESFKLMAVGFLLSGYVSIFLEVMQDLTARVHTPGV